MTGLIGSRVPRPQDHRLLRGRGRYVADVPAPGALHAAVVRSPVPHGRITGFDAADSGACALGPQEIAEHTRPLPTAWRLPGQQPDQVPLTAGTVRYTGQPIGLVVAAGRAEAEDAAEQVRLRIDRLPAVFDADAALAPGAPLLHPDNGTNRAGEAHFGDPRAEVEAAIADAAHVVERQLAVQRICPSPLETRGLLAEWDPAVERLTAHISTQSPHVVRQELAAALRLRIDQIRVVAPDVGGSFGSKVGLQAEEVLVCLAAVLLGRPVRWIEDRAEQLLAGYHGRGQRARARLALDADGRFRALHADIRSDLGAFAAQAGSGPAQVSGLTLEGPYRFERAGAVVTGVHTNTAPTAAYRGYGMQESSWIRERLIDEAARELGADPLQLRLRNLVDGPRHRTRTSLVLDGADHAGALRRAAELAGAHRAADEPGVRRGVGVTAASEVTAFAPSALLESFGIDWSGWEGATLRINPDGTVTAHSGVTSVGQGVETGLAQLVAEHLGVPMPWVSVQLGDTATTPHSDLTSQASRSLALAGTALARAADRMRERMRRLAARHLEAAPDAVVLDAEAGSYRAGTGEISWVEVARRGWKGWRRDSAEHVRLEEHVDFDPPAPTFACSAHAAAVAVDLATGQVRVEGYWAVHDSGRLVNPMLAEGQVVGGVAQGLGIALLEEVAYDPDSGRPRAATSPADYQLPTARDVPPVVVEHRCTPSEVIPGGYRGVGEGGILPPPATVAAAVAAAVPEIAAELTATPLTPMRIWAAWDAAQRR